jgi:hypothetical protein
VRIPLHSMQTDRYGFAALASLHHALSRFRNLELELDCSDATWIDGNMAAPLGGIIALARSRGNSISFTNMERSVRNVLSRSGFLDAPAVDYYKTSIPFKYFERSEAIAFAEYMEKQMQGRGMPNLSAQLRAKFLEGLDEIFNNAAIHSKSEHGIFCCGQAYPQGKKIKFTISDCGIGIRRSILENRGLVKTGEEAIDWAMTEGTTSRTGDVPGGLGLKILREFIEMNRGEIQIASENGYWTLCNRQVVTSPLFRPYPGTIVSIQINTADSNLYYLATEIDPNKVF